jgi:outer membrane biosynthesis protein TonB
MNRKSLLIAAALAGVSLTTAAFAYSSKDAAGSTPIPRVIPASVVKPIELPARFANATIDVSFYLDQNGQPRDIEVLRVDDPVLKKQLVNSFRQWRFDMSATSKEVAVRRFILPIHLLPEA